MSAIVSSKAISSITKPIAPIKFIIFLPVGVNRTLSEYRFDVVWTDRLANFNCAELVGFLLHQESQQYHEIVILKYGIYKEKTSSLEYRNLELMIIFRLSLHLLTS